MLKAYIQLNQKASSNIPNPYEGIWDVVKLALKLKANINYVNPKCLLNSS